MYSSGDVAQLGERRVRNAKVEGSIPFVSTKNRKFALFLAQLTQRRTRCCDWSGDMHSSGTPMTAPGVGPGSSRSLDCSRQRESRAFNMYMLCVHAMYIGACVTAK